MRCETCRTAVSARLDLEEPVVPDREVDAHVAACAPCRAYASDARTLQRAMRLLPAEPIPDLTPAILHAIGRERRPVLPDAGLRVCLALVAAVQIAVALPALVLGDDSGLPVHTAHHLGSFTVALAVGFAFAAWRPDRVGGLLPVAAALVTCLVGTSVLDVATGHAAPFGETGHVTEIVGLAIAWLLARPTDHRLGAAARS